MVKEKLPNIHIIYVISTKYAHFMKMGNKSQKDFKGNFLSIMVTFLVMKTCNFRRVKTLF